MTVKYSGVLTKRRDLGAFRFSEGGRLRRRGTPARAAARAEPRRPFGRGPGLPPAPSETLPRGEINNRVAPQGRRGRKAPPGAEVQRFTEQSKRELPSPLGTNSLVRR